jgi:hypothetical protein
VKEPGGSEFHIEYDRMMALMPREIIYLFDVCLLALFVLSSCERVAIGEVRPGGTPKNAWLRRGDTPAQIL